MLQLFSYPVLRRFVVLISGIISLSACATDQQIDHRATPEAGGQWQQKAAVFSQKSMISVANPLAAQAGYRILRAGGNAIDATIAAQLVLNLVEPQSSGIGGGGFLMMYDPQKQNVISFDGRETAPMKATPDLFIKEDGKKMGFFEAAVGGRAVGTPGLVHMLFDAHKKYGRISWPLLFDDAIKLASNGFKVSERLHSLIAKDKYLKDDPVARAYFYQEDGTALPVGHLLKNPAFADSLRQIQKGGAASFYLGQLADEIVDKVQKHPTNPGVLSFGDLQSYQTVIRKPVCMTYRNTYDICGMAPPSSGGVTVLEILGLMEQYDLNNDPKPVIDRAHLFMEASKLAFADRNHFLADPDFVKVPTEELLSKSYLTGRQTLIQDNSALAAPVKPGGPFLYGQAFAPHDTDHGISTTHMSVVDADGMVVSMTTSIENAFGARQMVGGFLLNNQLTDFSFLPEKNGVKIANSVEPQKRPRSSMAPTLVLDHKTKKPVLAIGSPGGSRIIGYVAQSLIAILDDKLPLDQALAQGHMTNRNGSSDLEKGTEAIAHQEKLEALGHKVGLKDMTSGLHAIQILPDGRLVGAADPRREGVVRGF